MGWNAKTIHQLSRFCLCCCWCSKHKEANVCSKDEKSGAQGSLVICYAFANYMAIYMRTRDFLSLVKHDLLGVSLHSVRNKNHSSRNF